MPPTPHVLAARELHAHTWGYIHTTLVPMSPSPTVALSAHCDILKVCVAGLRSDGTLVLCSKRPWSCTSTQTHTHTCSTHARHGTGSGRQPCTRTWRRRTAPAACPRPETASPCGAARYEYGGDSPPQPSTLKSPPSPPPPPPPPPRATRVHQAITILWSVKDTATATPRGKRVFTTGKKVF